jgi:hypothetical protein
MKLALDCVQWRAFLLAMLNPLILLVFFICEGPRSRCYGRTAALRLIVQPCDKDD